MDASVFLASMGWISEYCKKLEELQQKDFFDSYTRNVADALSATIHQITDQRACPSGKVRDFTVKIIIMRAL